ncbi:MAG: OprO/OprP family phosphate-selective porin [Endozoicomonas sp.]
MKLKPVSLAVAAITAGLALSMNASAGVVKTKGEDIVLSTKNGGLQLKTESGDFSFKVKGKLQWDYATYDKLFTNVVDPDDAYKNGRKGYIRRAEIGFSGKAYETWKYGLKLKSSSDTIKLDDAKITYTGLKPVDVTVGRWSRDYGLENTTSSSWIMGIERPMMYDLLNGDEGNDYGIEFSTGGDNYTAMLGIHNDGQKTDAKNSNEERLASYVFRGTFAPVMEDDMLVHLGFNYYNRNPDANSDVELSTNFGVKKAEKEKGVISAVKEDSEYLLEAAAQFQSLQLQAEYAVRELKSEDSTQDTKITGYYGQVSYMLDGGKRSYKGGAFSKPKGGQWEVFARFSKMELDVDGAVEKGKVDGYTLGVNYFPTKNIRTSLNYVNVEDNSVLAHQDDKGTAVVGRLQYVF